MMTIFSKILNMSITGSLVIAVVLLARLGLKKAPKIYSYALWAVVLFRLLCPVSLSAPGSVLEFADATVQSSPQGALVGTSSVNHFAGIQVPQVRPEWQTVQEPPNQEPVSRMDVLDVAALIWVLGVGVMMLYSLVTYWNLRKALAEAVHWRENIYLADRIDSPFVMGLVRPRVYLPSGTPAGERRYILAHEKHHIRRMDHIWKWLAYGALCLHWFNPLVWAAFILGGKDMEMSCDEAVIQKLGSQIRADYSQSLLRLATRRIGIGCTPLAFGEGDTKGRVKNMARWEKPKLWVSAVCIVLCGVILVACGVNPQQETTSGKLEVQFNDLLLSLPSGYEIEHQETGIVFCSAEETVVGGVSAYSIPEMYLITQDKDPSTWNAHEWLDALELPESVDLTMGYMGSGSIYGDYEVEYFRDLPEEEKEKVGDYVRFHTFFIGETQVYDVWFDRLAADSHLESAVLKSVKVQGIPQEGEPDQEDQEELALTKCKEAMEAFRMGAWGLQVQRLYSGEEDYHYSSHWCQDTSRLDLFSHPAGGTYDSKGNLLVDKEMYHGTASTEEIPSPGDLDWQAGTVDMDWAPWLTALDWTNSHTTYMDTLVDDGAVTVMLRIDTAYYEEIQVQDLEDFYFVNFLFNEEGGFLGIDLMVGLFREGGFTQQERVVKDAEIIAEQIAQAKP